MHLSIFQWTSLFAILGISLAGGYYPLIRREQVEEPGSLPLGEAFASGVFLALAVLLMLPNAQHLFGMVDPGMTFPWGHFFAAVAFLTLLGLTHFLHSDSGKDSPIIPIIMTAMIAIPSFLLGTAFGVSSSISAVVIAVAIMAHKGSAGFALALSMARSTLTRAQAITIYLLFACSTPTGILVGVFVHNWLTGSSVTAVKAVILALASGVFLFMATLHELKDTPMIASCNTLHGFGATVVGFVLTAFIRAAMGIAQTGHVPDHW